jgi:hypothetical protein
MTKKQWNNITIGTEVKTELCVINGDKKIVSEITGKIVRINSNHSQVLISFNDDKFERWYGRLSIELVK